MVFNSLTDRLLALQKIRACRVADAHRLSELRYILWRRDGNPAAAQRLDPPGALPPLPVAANAVAPVRRAMAAVAQAAADTADYAADHAEARLQPLERATALLANELEVATIRSEQEPISRERLHPMPTAIGAYATAVAEFLGTIAARIARCYSRVRQKDWRLQDWRLQDWSLQDWSLQDRSPQDRSPQISLLHVARLQFSRLHVALLQVSRLQLIIAGLILADAAIIGWRTDLVWAMPQTASSPLRPNGMTASPSSSSRVRSATAQTTSKQCRICASPSATCSVRRYILGPPRWRAGVWLPARRWHFAANLLCHRQIRATLWSGSSIATIAFEVTTRARSSGLV